MANPEHFALLKKGVGEWNKWRNRLQRPRTGKRKVFQVDPDFRNANLSKRQLIGVNLIGADMSGAKLRCADLTFANLVHANLQKADLRGAQLYWANLSNLSVIRDANGSVLFGKDGANLEGANLAGAALYSTDLSNASFVEANFDSAVLGSVRFSNTDLSRASGLEKCHYGGPSQVDFLTLSKSWPLPLAFLRGVGLPDAVIEFLPSLLTQPIQFYSCFISYTEMDDAFSKRLYNDLQGQGIRCWRWREDAKWGRTVIGEVDSAIRLHDKVVVILSKHSLRSEPVIQEIDRALQREARENKEVLFPIRLDDAIFSWEHPLQADVLRKVIGDFRRWRDSTAYAGSLKQLIRCLNAA